MLILIALLLSAGTTGTVTEKLPAPNAFLAPVIDGFPWLTLLICVWFFTLPDPKEATPTRGLRQSIYVLTSIIAVYLLAETVQESAKIKLHSEVCLVVSTTIIVAGSLLFGFAAYYVASVAERIPRSNLGY